AASGGKSRALRPGDEIPLRQTPGGPAVRLVCLCANGEVVPDRPGAPENPVARAHKPKPADPSDNAKSLGFLLRYGDFRILDLGAQENADPEFIANPDEKCAAEGIALAVAPDGKSYTVTVGGKGKPRRYETRGEK